MEAFLPWESYPDLTLQRISLLGNTVKAARNSSADAYDPDSGDNRWSRGCSAYARQCNMLRELKTRVDWMTLTSDSRDHLEFTLAVGRIPLKICRGDLEEDIPRIGGFAHGEQILMDLEFATKPFAPLRIVVESDARGYVEKIYLAEFDGTDIARYFDIPLDDSDSGEFTLPTPDPVSPLPIEGRALDNDERGAASA